MLKKLVMEWNESILPFIENGTVQKEEEISNQQWQLNDTWSLSFTPSPTPDLFFSRSLLSYLQVFICFSEAAREYSLVEHLLFLFLSTSVKIFRATSLCNLIPENSPPNGLPGVFCKRNHPYNKCLHWCFQHKPMLGWTQDSWSPPNRASAWCFWQLRLG